MFDTICYIARWSRGLSSLKTFLYDIHRATHRVGAGSLTLITTYNVNKSFLEYMYMYLCTVSNDNSHYYHISNKK